MYYVGIDWADEEHYAYITDDSGQKLDSFPMEHSEEGMSKLQNRIHRFSLKLDNVLFSLETDNGLVVSTLREFCNGEVLDMAEMRKEWERRGNRLVDPRPNVFIVGKKGVIIHEQTCAFRRPEDN